MRQSPSTTGRETVYGRRSGKVLHLDYLFVGDSGPLGENGLHEGDEFKYILDVMDNLNNFVWLKPTKFFTAAEVM